MRIVESIIRYYIGKRAKRFALSLENALVTQEAIFSKIIKKNTSTLFFTEHKINSNDSHSSFIKKVPVRTYEDFFPYIEKELLYQKNILTPGHTVRFAKSSGTTNARSKFIPLPKENILNNHYKGSGDMIAWIATHFTSKPFFLGKNILITGSFSHFKEYPHAKIGDISAHLIYELPLYARLSRGTKLKTSLMDTWDKKRLQIIKDSFSKKVTMLFGAPTWMLHIFDTALDFTKKKTIKDVWPHLNIFFHGAVNLKPYKEIFEQKVGRTDMTYVNVYNASEGFIGFQYAKDKSDEFVLATNHGIFYEFVSVSDYRKNTYNTVSLKDVVLGEEYAVILTTTGGLYRYSIGDTIVFTSTSPYLFKLTGRTKQFLNTFGEEVVVEQIENAVTVAQKEVKLGVLSYTVSSYMEADSSSGGHEWLVEFQEVPSKNDVELFLQSIDTYLKSINSDYDAKRYNDLVMKKPRVIVASSGTFIRWLAQKNKLGGQHKVPLLSDDRAVLEDIKLHI